MKKFETRRIVELRSNICAITQSELIREEDVPYLCEIINIAKGHYDRPKDFFLAWERMLIMKDGNHELITSPSLSLAEALFMLFYEQPKADARKHFSIFCKLVNQQYDE